jgi:hypothetical protein
MSATIMRYTRQWAQLVPIIRNIISDQHADVKVGIGLNFNNVDATETRSALASDADGYFVGSGQRAAAPAPAADGQQAPLAKGSATAPKIDSTGVKQLLQQVIDFVGVSVYAPITGPDFRLNELENSAFVCGDNLRYFADGVRLADLVRAGKLELHYSEFGLGGGSPGNQRVCTAYLVPWGAH